MTEQEDNNSCHYFNEHYCHTIGLTRGISGFVALLTSMTALLVIMLLKAFKKYSQRLFLYLTFATLLHAPVYIMEVMSVECHTKDNSSSYPKAQEPLCTITGVADIYSSWLQNLIILWITAYLFRIVVLRKIINTMKLELSIIIVFTIIPIPVAVIPYLVNNKYGINGAWCWFITYKEKHCEEIDWWGLGYQLGIWNIPFFIETLVIIVTLSTILVVLIRRGFTMTQFRDFRLEYRRLLKESLLLLIFPGIYCIINIFEIIVDMIGIKNDLYPLWLIDAVLNPSKAVLVIGGYLISILWIKQKRWRERRLSLVIAQTEGNGIANHQYGSVDITSSISTESTTFSLKK